MGSDAPTGEGFGCIPSADKCHHRLFGFTHQETGELRLKMTSVIQELGSLRSFTSFFFSFSFSVPFRRVIKIYTRHT